MEGDPANGYSRGALCMRCLDLVEAMYAEDRLKYPYETRLRGPRQGRMGAHHVGGGVRPHRGEGALLPADLRRRLHRGAAGHRPQHHVLPFHGPAPHRVQQPVRHRRVPVRQLVLWAARVGHGAHGRLLFDLRHVPGAARTLRLPRLRAARMHPRVGQRRHRVEPGRLFGTLDGGGHEAGAASSSSWTRASPGWPPRPSTGCRCGRPPTPPWPWPSPT